MSKANQEQGQSIEAGTPALTREQWIAEVRRLCVEKYDFPESETASYADALAETFFDEDPANPEKPDDAIYEDLSAGL